MIISDDSNVCLWEDCGMSFASSKECFEHVKRNHIPTRAQVCKWNNCNKTSSVRSNLISHLRKHIPMNIETCYLCNRPFKRKGDFIRHNKNHTEVDQQFNAIAKLLFK
eukprot:NODE_639_length_5670_cov_0.131754.p5 type:complete len:108 gc:universal NODE_639_length_5670_cov_0.131754:2275-2598(+)